MNAPGRPDVTGAGAARDQRAPQVSGGNTARVEYRSSGQLLIIGERRSATAAAARLAGGVTVAQISGHAAGLGGYLGNFKIELDDTSGGAKTDTVRHGTAGCFDLVLDLNAQPALAVEVPPPGYFATRGDAAALDRALEEISALTGVFEKPVYFSFDAAVCAHGRRGLTGCERCINACPTGAIVPSGDSVAIDPYLCQGCGTCTLVCPTGAVRYAYPRPSVLLDRLREALREERNAGRPAPVVLFHEGDQAPLAADDDRPVPLRTFPVEAIAATGMESWFSALAYGAAGVRLAAGPDVPASDLAQIRAELHVAGDILAAMGYSRQRLAVVAAGAFDAPDGTALAPAAPDPGIEPATFAGFDDKRLVLRTALAHLHAHAPNPVAEIPLAAGAAFGAVRLDRDACTLCMACVAVCPSGALQDGATRPALTFAEADCVQCGLCVSGCPENALALVPRLSFEAMEAGRELLHEEQPFCCVRCGKPFATAAIIRRMTAQLEGHAMFREPAARRRLEMCADCRVADIHAAEQTA